MGVRTKYEIDDKPGEGEGILVIKIGDRNSIEIAGVRIHLNFIKSTGAGGGSREVSLLLVGPKTVKINRIERPE